MFRFIFALVVAVASVRAFASAPPADWEARVKASGIAQDEHWRRLLHFQRNKWGFVESQADGKEFFMSPRGKRDAEAELVETVRGFLTNVAPEKREEIPQCQYPARLKFLRGRLPLDEWGFTPVACERYEKFKAEADAVAVSIVFSAFDASNPASVFGHTFYRIHKRREEGKDQELLDLGMNFAADVPPGVNKLWFMVGGIFGAFPGEYSDVIFYRKVQEYSNFDVRDLWTYELDLSPDEIDYLIAHLWELGHTHFDYFFFTENCSYHIISALEATSPRIVVKDKVPFYTIPAATLRALNANPGLVKRVVYRPSIGTTFQYRYKLLTDEERAAFLANAGSWETVKLPETLSVEARMHVLDTLMDYHAFRFAKSRGNDEHVESWRGRLLGERAKLGVRSPTLEIPRPESKLPHTSHPDARVSLGAFGGSRHPRGGVDLEYRFALHDLLDSTRGYPDNFQVEFMRFNARYFFESRRLRFQEWRIVDISSLAEFTRILPRNSQGLGVSVKRVEDARCADCIAGELNFFYGLTFRPLTDRPHYLFAVTDFKGATSRGFLRSKATLGVGPRVGYIARFTEDWGALADVGYLYTLGAPDPHSYSVGAGTRFTWASRWSIDAQYSLKREGYELSSSLRYAF